MSRFRFTAAASEDLREIIEYLAAEGSPEIARRFVQGLTERCQSLADIPGMGRRREELSAGLRSVPAEGFPRFGELL